jgi:hypothetical protein
VTIRLENLEDRVAEMHAAMIESDGDVHLGYATRARSASARVTTLSTV